MQIYIQMQTHKSTHTRRNKHTACISKNRPTSSAGFTMRSVILYRYKPGQSSLSDKHSQQRQNFKKRKLV